MALPVDIAMAAILLGALYSLILWERRMRTQQAQAITADARERLQSVAHAVLAGDQITATPRRDERVLTELLVELAPVLTGDSRRAIAAHFESTGGVLRVCRRLADPRALRRAEHAARLGDMCSELAQVPLQQALNDRDSDVRLAAARSLGRLGSGAATGPLLYALLRGLVPRIVVANSLLAIGAATLPGIRRMLTEDQPAARAVAAELLGRLGDPSDTAALQARLGDPAPVVREHACEALGRLGAGDAAAAIKALLGDDVADVRKAAAAALAAVGDEHSAPPLLGLVHEDCAEVAEVAARTLAAIVPELVLRLAAHEDAHPRLRHAASQLVAGVG